MGHPITFTRRSAPILRIDGRLRKQEGYPLLTNDDIKQMLDQITSQEQRDHLSQEKELDFSYELELKARFRINVMIQGKHSVWHVACCRL